MGRPRRRIPETGKLTPPTPEPEPDQGSARDRNYRKAVETCKAWCAARGVDAGPRLDRLVFAVMTESGGLNHANDGGAFFPDAAARRPGWAEGVADSVVNACYKVLRTSMAYGHDAIGNNGGSTGVLQQLSQDYVGARFPGKTWGWGTLADTMDVGKACEMFLARLTVSSDTTYSNAGVSVTGLDPVAVDVLRVQQPLASEARSSNYSAAQVAAAKAIVRRFQ